MNYVDIVIIAVIAFMALWGLWKSFTKTLVKILCFAIALVGTYFLADFVIKWLLGIPFINGLIVGDGFSLSGLYYDAIGGADATAVAEGSALQYFLAPMIERFNAAAIGTTYGLTIGKFLSINLAINTLNIVLCVLLYAILRLVAWIISWILTKIFVHGTPNVFSRLLGFVCGAVRGAALVMILLVASTTILPFSWAQDYNESLANKSVIGKVASEYTYQIYDWAIYGGANSSEKTIELIEAAGYKAN